jgi:hypothetical protein
MAAFIGKSLKHVVIDDPVSQKKHAEMYFPKAKTMALQSSKCEIRTRLSIAPVTFKVVS